MQNKTAEERMDLLLQTMDDIIMEEYADEADSAPSSDFAKRYWDKLCAVYDDPEFRHSYSRISSWLECYDPEQRDALPVSINRITMFAETQTDQEHIRRIIKAVRKLQDHVELECIRLNRMRQVEFLADEARESQNKAMVLNEATKKTVKKLNKRVDGFHEQSITILGIFSAVVIGFMADLSMFTSGFDKLSEANVYIVTFYSVVVGIIVFDTLFMMIFFIAKISGHSIARDYPKHRNWLVSTWHRYPYLYCFHAFAIVVLAVLVALQRIMTIIT